MFGFLEKFKSARQPEIPPASTLKVEKPEETPDNDEIERILETRAKVSGGRLEGDNKNAVFLYGLENDGKGIFKPKKGENGNVIGGIEVGTYFKRERAAYLISHAMGLDLVPPTVIRVIDGEVGSFQRFVDGKDGWLMSQEDWDRKKEGFVKLWILDYIIWSAERHLGNFLANDSQFYAIDNGLSLKDEEFRPFESRYSKAEVADEKLSPEVIDGFDRFLAGPELKEKLKEAVAKLVGEKSAKACLFRIENIAKAIIKEGCVPVDFDPQFGLEE